MSDELTTAAITKEALEILNAELSGVPRYYKVRQLDGTWCICEGYPNGPIIKDKMTEAEVNAYLKLLRS